MTVTVLQDDLREIRAQIVLFLILLINTGSSLVVRVK